MKLKSKSLCQLKHCTECFKPIYLKFNFSFMKYDEKDFTEEHKKALFDRIVELSTYNYQLIASWRKKIGFEKINEKIIKKQISIEFAQSDRNRDDKYTIFRLYPNNNPLNSRIIGKEINKVFYILFIDIKGKLYKH